MESPPPAVFHDKAKRTQQGDLLATSPISHDLTYTCKVKKKYFSISAVVV